MPLPDLMVQPVRAELVHLGFKELRTPDDVDAVLRAQTGTVLVAVNSMCGCASSRMRPGVRLALQQAKQRPDQLTTVFAGQDLEATTRAREYFVGYPPSSPSVALLKDGKVIYMMERRNIERRHPEDIARELANVLDEFCT